MHSSLRFCIRIAHVHLAKKHVVSRNLKSVPWNPMFGHGSRVRSNKTNNSIGSIRILLSLLRVVIQCDCDTCWLTWWTNKYSALFMQCYTGMPQLVKKEMSEWSSRVAQTVSADYVAQFTYRKSKCNLTSSSSILIIGPLIWWSVHGFVTFVGVVWFPIIPIIFPQPNDGPWRMHQQVFGLDGKSRAIGFAVMDGRTSRLLYIGHVHKGHARSNIL